MLPLNSLVSTTGNTPAKTIRDILLEKHPPAKPLVPSAVCMPENITPEPHPIHFDRIDGLLMRTVVLKMDRAAGPSGIDAAGWKRLCTSFRTHSADLCDALASLAKRICTTYVYPKGLEAFMASRLIALNKCPPSE